MTTEAERFRKQSNQKQNKTNYKPNVKKKTQDKLQKHYNKSESTMTSLQNEISFKKLFPQNLCKF